MSDTDPKTLHETHYERLIMKRSFYINEQTYLWTRQHATTQCDYKINSNNVNKASKWTNNLFRINFSCSSGCWEEVNVSKPRSN